MSQENVDLVRTVFEAFGRADIAAVAGLLHPEIELKENFELSTSPGPHLGIEGLMAWYREGGQNWSAYETELIEAIPAGDNTVVAEGEVRATGRMSGVRTTHRFGYLFRVAEGRISRFEIFATRREALEAAGLSE